MRKSYLLFLKFREKKYTDRGSCQAAGRKIMRMFRIKMTAARTNPQQIREVRIDSEKTVGELLELVRIVYEYGGCKRKSVK